MEKKTFTWPTEDDCTSCGHPGMIFNLEKVVPAPDIFGDPSAEAVGNLVCPACGASSLAYSDVCRVPNSYWKSL